MTDSTAVTTTATPITEPPLELPLPLGEHGTLHPQFKQIRDTHPVCPVLMPSGHRMHMLTRHDDIQAALRDPRFSRNLTAPDGPRMMGPGLETIVGGIFNLDPPDHTRVRRVIAPFYARNAVRKHAPMIKKHVDERIDLLITGPNPTDLQAAFTAPLALAVSCDTLGISHDQRKAISEAFHTEIEIGPSPETIQDATDRILAFARNLADSEDVAPDGPIAALIAAHHDGRISSDELVGTIVFLFVTAIDSIMGPITMGVLTLLRHPGQLTEVLRTPTLWPRAVEEILRYHHNGQLSFARVALEDVELHDVTIHKGEAILTPALGATWDERRYKRPEKFNLHRNNGDEHFANPTFGAGPHFCIGAWFARMQLKITFSTLFTRLSNLALAINVDDVPWDHNILFTRPAELPITW